jgi:hypothetical protein
MTDRDEIQKAMNNLGKRLRPSTGNQHDDDQARLGVHGADGQYLGVPAYIGNEERDHDERSELSTVHGDFSQT